VLCTAWTEVAPHSGAERPAHKHRIKIGRWTECSRWCGRRSRVSARPAACWSYWASSCSFHLLTVYLDTQAPNNIFTYASPMHARDTRVHASHHSHSEHHDPASRKSAPKTQVGGNTPRAPTPTAWKGAAKTQTGRNTPEPPHQHIHLRVIHSNIGSHLRGTQPLAHDRTRSAPTHIRDEYLIR
jgi:hypothetical protein